uniref:DSC-2 n=1 Tax=Lymnaea stagnalis TaxID=6523 RepID=Q75R56_LYMST|nr:DSC-2 [Lymnaea stagnalis]
MDCRLYFSVLFGVLLMEFAKSSYIALESNTSVIHPILIKKLQMRCAVRRDANFGQGSETQTQLYNLITASQTKHASDRMSTPERKDSEGLNSSSSHADLYRLLSIVITVGDRDNIASVTGCDAPIVEENFSEKIHADGSCDSSPGDDEQGYLLLTLDRPLAKHAGTFTCEASALDSEKNPISIRTSLRILAVEPTLADAVEYISINDKHIADLKEQIVQLREESETIKEGQSKMEHFEYNKIKGQNIQTGGATCDRHTITFARPYKEPPTVFVAIQSVTSNSNYFSTNSVTVEEVDEESFTINCVAGSYLTATFQWLAIDN